MLFCCLFFFSKSTFLKKIISGITSVSNSLDPGQARQNDVKLHFVRSNLGPTVCKGLEFKQFHLALGSSLFAWVKVFRINPEFRILRPTCLKMLN